MEQHHWEMAISNFTEKQKDIRKDLYSKSKPVPCFTYEGYKFYTSQQYAINQFLIDNPTGGDFFVWLQQNFKFSAA